MTAAPDSPLATLWCPAPNREPRRDGRMPDMLVLHYTGMGPRCRARLADGAKSRRSPATILSTRTGASPRWCASQSAPGMPGKACGRAKPTSIPARSASRFTIPVTSSATAISRGADARRGGAVPRYLGPPPHPSRAGGGALRYRAGTQARSGREIRLGAAGSSWRRALVQPAPLGEDQGLGPGDEGPEVLKLQQDLAGLGYGWSSPPPMARGSRKWWKRFSVTSAKSASTVAPTPRRATRLAGCWRRCKQPRWRETTEKGARRSQRRDWTKRAFGYIPKADNLANERPFKARDLGNIQKAYERNAMTRAPILSAVAAALLLGLAAAWPRSGGGRRNSGDSGDDAVSNPCAGQGRVRQLLRHGPH